MSEVNEHEIDEAVRVCFYLIDNPPPQYRIVKQAVQGITHLSTIRTELRPLVLLKLLQVLQQPKIYRSNPRRFAVRSIGVLTYHDESLVTPAVGLLSQLVKRENEQSQYVRKAAFCALSRIGRKYPAVQNYILPLFEDAYNNPHEKDSIIWGVLIGWGRLCQSNAVLRSNVFPRLVEMCSSRSFKLRWGAIKALGHASCPIGNVSNDKSVEQKCFELALQLLQAGGAKISQTNNNNSDMKQSSEKTNEPDPWKREDVYLVQYAAMQALSLLLRSNPDHWWSSISGILKDVLTNGRYAAIVKASCLLTYGKLAYYMSEDNPYYTNLKNLLFDLSHHDNILVSEPACYSLVNLCLAHPPEFQFVKNLIREKLGGSLTNAPTQALEYYLKTWCKLISKDYRTVLNQCSTVMSMHTQSDTASFAPGFDDATSQGKKINDESATKLSDSATAADSNKLLELCTNFSTAVLGSILALFKDSSMLNHTQFRKNLKVLVQDYQNKSSINTEMAIDQTGLLKLFKDIWNLDPILRENAVTIMNYPAILDNPLWVANLQSIIENLNQLKRLQPAFSQPAPFIPTPEVPQQASSSFFAPLPLLPINRPEPLPQVSSAADFFAPLPSLPSAPRDPRLQRYQPEPPRVDKPQLEPLPFLPTPNTLVKPVRLSDQPQPVTQPPQEPPAPLLMDLNEEEEEDLEFVLNVSAEEIKFPPQRQSALAAPVVPDSSPVTPIVPITQPEAPKPQLEIPVMAIPQELESESDDEWNPSNIEGFIQPTQTPLQASTLPAQSAETSTQPIPVHSIPQTTPPHEIYPNLSTHTTDEHETNHSLPSFQHNVDSAPAASSNNAVNISVSSSEDRDENAIPLDESDEEEDGVIKQADERPITAPQPASSAPQGTHTKRKNRKKRKREAKKPNPKVNDQKPSAKATAPPKEIKKAEPPASSGTILSSILASEDFKGAADDTFDEIYDLDDSTTQEKEKDKEELPKEQKKSAPKKPRKKAPEKERPQDICKFYLAGLCKRGQDCTFAHVGTPTPVKHSELCKFFKSGFCLKGDQCMYSHDLKSLPCKYFLETGHCAHGANCKYGHFYPNQTPTDQAPPVMTQQPLIPIVTPPVQQVAMHHFALPPQMQPLPLPVQIPTPPPPQPTNVLPQPIQSGQPKLMEGFPYQSQPPDDDDFAGSYLAACYERTS